jgi:hypothetical protein
LTAERPAVWFLAGMGVAHAGNRVWLFGGSRVAVGHTRRNNQEAYQRQNRIRETGMELFAFKAC